MSLHCLLIPLSGAVALVCRFLKSPNSVLARSITLSESAVPLVVKKLLPGTVNLEFACVNLAVAEFPIKPMMDLN